MKRNKLGLGIFITLFLSACSTTDMMGGFNLISPEQEMTLGQELSQSIAQQEKIITDKPVNDYVTQIGQRLVAASNAAGQPRYFYVLQKDEVNAFAIPGGHVYVHTGLIEAADNEAEVAAVIAHELAHAERRHPTQQLSRQIGTQMVMDLVFGKNAGQLQQTAASLVATSGISAYSRSAEFEADAIGTTMLNQAGYDPAAMATFFNKLAMMERQAGVGETRNFFATHPPTQDRIQAVENLVASFGAQRSTKPSQVGDFNGLKAQIKALRK
ncbi:MAG: M48 family metallopeptidase [bacterium]|jgi:predicted Zn-dependent protease|nr:M48 family metallopeptidase [bacterium]